MSLTFTAPTPLDYFGSLVASDRDFALFEAAVSLSQDEYPELDVQNVLEQVDRLTERIRVRLPADAAALQRLRMLNIFFFQELGFSGNVNDYYDPDNSFLPRLLETRRGIPVSLALLWMELAQGIGLNVAGIGFPGHFMVRVELPMGVSVLDPMTGHSLSREALSERLALFQAGDVSAAADFPLGAYLQAASPRSIIARMLRNLKEIYKSQQDWPRLLAVQQRLVLLLPQSWDEYRDRGLAYAELGQTELALADLECYLVHSSELPDGAGISGRLNALRGTR